jgi:hypothetical protein
MRSLILGFWLVPLFAAGCVSSAPLNRLAARPNSPKSLISDNPTDNPAHNPTFDDYTLTGPVESTSDTNFFLENPSDEATTDLPDFAFTPGTADSGDEVSEQMFPDAPGSVEDALGEVHGVEVYTVTADGAFVHAEAAMDAPSVRPRAKGERIVGGAPGAFARIGKGEFVPLESLEVKPQPPSTDRASLP